MCACVLLRVWLSREWLSLRARGRPLALRGARTYGLQGYPERSGTEYTATLPLGVFRNRWSAAYIMAIFIGREVRMFETTGLIAFIAFMTLSTFGIHMAPVRCRKAPMAWWTEMAIAQQRIALLLLMVLIA